MAGQAPKDNAFKALEEITSWLDSLKDAPGFRPEMRAAIIMLLDEAGQPLYAELLHLYLGAPHSQDFRGSICGDACTDDWIPWPALSVCIHKHRRTKKGLWITRKSCRSIASGCCAPLPSR